MLSIYFAKVGDIYNIHKFGFIGLYVYSPSFLKKWALYT